MESRLWYFAYGSNMDSARLESRLKRSSIQSQIGSLEGYELTFNKKAPDGSGYANIQAKEGQSVYGVLYELTKQELAKLDRYEGVPEHYKHMPVRVRTASGPVEAICYVAADDKIQEGLQPRQDYLERLINGAREHGLPASYIQKLMGWLPQRE